MKAKHTPGPWEAHGCTIYTSDRWLDGTNYGAQRIAQSYRDDSDAMPSTEEYANAVLIAAAPDLLAALKQCYSDLQRYAPNSTGSVQARAALAKAQGES
jgi:hypothetical protein